MIMEMKKYTKSFDKQIGENIKMFRKTCNITQGYLGEKLGISAQQVNKYEAGTDRVSVSTLYKIANILHCDIDLLLPKEEQDGTNIQGSSILKVAESGVDYKCNRKSNSNNALELLKLFFKMSKNEQSALIQQLKNKVEKNN